MSPSLYVSSVLYILLPNHLPSDRKVRGAGGLLGSWGRGSGNRSWEKYTKIPKWEGRSSFKNQPLSGH